MEAVALRIHPDDDVASLLSPVIAGGVRVRVAGFPEPFYTKQAILSGHKIALRSLSTGALIKKFGLPFGRTIAAIEPGDWVHTHNVATALGQNETYTYAERLAVPLPAPTTSPETRPMPTFEGYVRADGRVGIRNELWVLCTVGCVNRAAEEIARRAHQKLGKEFGGPVDGVYAHTHPYGCAQIGGDLTLTRNALSALAAHPNCAGVLLFGLGCENNQLKEQVEALRNADMSRVRWFSAQEVEDEIAAAVDLLTELAEQAARDERVTLPASALVLGMKCGGSDGFSGLTANPLVGILSDRLAQWGGISVLTEVPEMFGAERLLMARTPDETTFNAVAAMINNFKDYFRRYNEPISENPSPGNKAGGITTLEEKSLGCVQKGGVSAPVRYVLNYGETLAGSRQKKEEEIPNAQYPVSVSGGLALVYAPGNDAVSCTALAASGAQMVLFTTGRGTPFGTCVPTLKISTNSDLSRRKPHWIDFDAGKIAEGADPQTLADDLLALVLKVASGELTRSEIQGYREIAIFKDGVTL